MSTLSLPSCTITTALSAQNYLRYNAEVDALTYLNRYQFEGGKLFRAILGREVLWDEATEQALMNDLDKVYEELTKKKLYSLKTYQLQARYMTVIGVLWVDGTPPLNRSLFQPLTALSLHSKDIVEVRRDMTTTPPRVDLQAYCHRLKRDVTVSLYVTKWAKMKTYFKEIKSDGKIYETKPSEPDQKPVPKVPHLSKKPKR